MAKKSSVYWKRRMESVADAQNKHADTYIEDLEKQYQSALQSIQRDIEQFYIRYADAEKVDMVTARKMLSQAEKEMWEVSLEEYRKMALDEEFIDQIESMYSKSRVSRLQAIQSQIQAQIEVLYKALNDNLETLLSDTFADTYYQTTYEVQKGVGIATSFALFNEDAVKKVISKPWKHGNFSSTVWNNKTLLLDELETSLSQAFIRGDSMDKVIKAFDKRMKVGYSRAANIIQTEHAYIAGEATAKSYSETGIEQYEYLATLDIRTSKVCQSMDGRVFKVSERSVGLNYPPLHCRCRSTTVPYFDDDIEDYGKRIARDHEGKSYYVPENMKYNEWYKKYVADESAENSINYELGDMKEDSKHRIKKVFDKLKKDYNTPLTTISRGAKGVGIKADTDITGQVIRLNTANEQTLYHEFGHTLASTKRDKWGLSDDKVFWKEIRKIRTQYKKAIRDNVELKISSYADESLDEFMCEAFGQYKALQDGYKLGYEFGTDTTYSKKIVDVVDKYFKR